LAALLDDARPKVRDQVVTQLGKRGDAVEALRPVLKQGLKKSVLARRNAVWALARVRTNQARSAVREALADPDASVRQAAAHVVRPGNDPAPRPRPARHKCEAPTPTPPNPRHALQRKDAYAPAPAPPAGPARTRCTRP